LDLKVCINDDLQVIGCDDWDPLFSCNDCCNGALSCQFWPKKNDKTGITAIWQA
jgi:hypothetical protein